jgi:hypothetical protein
MLLLPRGNVIHSSKLSLHSSSSGHMSKGSIGTLVPSSLTSSDFLDIGRLALAKVRVPSGQRVSLRYRAHRRAHIPFPEDTRGFLYFLPGPANVPIAGEVRFRVTSSPDTTSFAQGQDLRRMDKLGPWRIHLASVLRSRDGYLGLSDLLVNQDRVVERRLITASRAVAHRACSETPVIHSLGQPFILDASEHATSLYIAAQDTLHPIIIMGITDQRNGGQYAPYMGMFKNLHLKYNNDET